MKALKLYLQFYLVLSLLALPCVLVCAQGTNPSSVLGSVVRDFRLMGTDGREYTLQSLEQARGCMVVFSCNHCPFAKLYTERLNALSKKYSLLGVPLLVINPMDTLMYEEEGFVNMQERARTQNFQFPYLIDASQEVARSFRAKHTPQAYVVWKENGKWLIRYAGAIDDNGEHPEQAVPFLANAVDALLASKDPARSETLSLGCRITYRKR